MGAYLPALCTALACTLAALAMIALDRKAAAPAERDSAWRDRLPLLLRIVRPILRWYAPGVDESLPAQKREALQARLNGAGMGYLVTPAEFILLRRLALCAGFALAAFVVLVLDVDDAMYLLLAGALAPVAHLYPVLWLRDTGRRRQAAFEKDFPFFLDVLVLAMRAGLTFAAATEHSVDALRSGPVKQEFARYLRETRTGASRRAALERLALRVPAPAVANFTASVLQAEETGGSLGDVLADQARQRRQERFLRAEKLANQAPVKMLFPLIALLFPVTFIIIGFPIVVQLVDSGAIELFRRG